MASLAACSSRICFVAYVVTLSSGQNCSRPVISMLSGLGLLAGILGRDSRGAAAACLDAFGWRRLMLAPARAGHAGPVTWGPVRDDPGAGLSASYALSESRHRRPERLNALAAFGSCPLRQHPAALLHSGQLLGSVLTFCGLWGVPYLTTHYAFHRPGGLPDFAADDLLGFGEPGFRLLSTGWAAASR